MAWARVRIRQRPSAKIATKGAASIPFGSIRGNAGANRYKRTARVTAKISAVRVRSLRTGTGGFAEGWTSGAVISPGW